MIYTLLSNKEVCTEDLRSKIRALRIQLGFTQVQLAELLGVTYVTISRWENGKVRPNRLALRAVSALVQDVPDSRCLATIKKPGVTRVVNTVRSSSKIHKPKVLIENRTAKLPKADTLGLDMPAALEVRVDILKKSRIFSELSRMQCLRLSKMAVERNVKSGQFVFREGDPVAWFFVVAEGKVKILRHSPAGKDFLIGLGGPGDMLGNIAILSDKLHSSSTQAVSDTKVLAIRNDNFLSYLDNNPDVGYRVFRRMLISVGAWLSAVMERITDLAVETAEYRVTYILFRLSHNFGSSIPFTREEVAQMAGTATETAIRIMNHLKNTGIIRPARHKIIILDKATLGAQVETSRRRK